MSAHVPQPPARWLRADGSTVACTESIKVLEENWREAAEMLELLGVGKSAFKLAMHQLVDGLDCAYAEKRTVDGDRTKTE